MYQPIKQRTTLTLDEYVIEWFERESSTDEYTDSATRPSTRCLLDYIMRKRFPNWDKVKRLQQPRNQPPSNSHRALNIDKNDPN